MTQETKNMSEQEQPESNAAVASPAQFDLLCVDCGSTTFDVPFDCGDGGMRCAGCAVDKYMTRSYPVEVRIKNPIFCGNPTKGS